ncbi:MAG: hypothetical protein ACXU9U_02695 [Parachlamydiaceae bacterium]
MLEQRPFLCSSSYSYLLNYTIQSNMYDCADKNTEETKDLKLFGMSVWCASNALTLVARVAAIPEVFLLGAGIFLTAPFTANPIKNGKIGLHEIFVHTPKNILRVACVPIEFFIGTILNYTDPKLLIIEMSKCMRVNLLHAKNGTLHSNKHLADLRGISGDVKVKYMAWQEKMFEH